MFGRKNGACGSTAIRPWRQQEAVSVLFSHSLIGGSVFTSLSRSQLPRKITLAKALQFDFVFAGAGVAGARTRSNSTATLSV